MIELEQTADGSYTLFVPELNEHYHSVKGALTESEHIFINMGMKHHPSSTPVSYTHLTLPTKLEV